MIVWCLNKMLLSFSFLSLIGRCKRLYLFFICRCKRSHFFLIGRCKRLDLTPFFALFSLCTYRVTVTHISANPNISFFFSFHLLRFFAFISIPSLEANKARRQLQCPYWNGTLYFNFGQLFYPTYRELTTNFKVILAYTAQSRWFANKIRPSIISWVY